MVVFTDEEELHQAVQRAWAVSLGLHELYNNVAWIREWYALLQRLRYDSTEVVLITGNAQVQREFEIARNKRFGVRRIINKGTYLIEINKRKAAEKHMPLEVIILHELTHCMRKGDEYGKEVDAQHLNMILGYEPSARTLDAILKQRGILI